MFTARYGLGLQIYFRLIFVFNGRTTVQAVSCRHRSAVERVRSPVGPCEFCGRQSANETGFSPTTSFSTASIIPTMIHTHLFLEEQRGRSLGTFQKTTLFPKQGSNGEKSAFNIFRP